MLEINKFWLGLCFSFKIFIYLFSRDGGREGERERNISASHAPPIGDLAHNPGVCPDWDPNWRLFDLQAGAQSTEPHQSELFFLVFFFFLIVIQLQLSPFFPHYSSWPYRPPISHIQCCSFLSLSMGPLYMILDLTLPLLSLLPHLLPPQSFLVVEIVALLSVT